MNTAERNGGGLGFIYKTVFISILIPSGLIVK